MLSAFLSPFHMYLLIKSLLCPRLNKQYPSILPKPSDSFLDNAHFQKFSFFSKILEQMCAQENYLLCENRLVRLISLSLFILTPHRKRRVYHMNAPVYNRFWASDPILTGQSMALKTENTFNSQIPRATQL